MITAPHLHAMLIHFPIALLLIGFITEAVALITKKHFFKNAAFYLLLLGALGTIAAYISGGYAGDGMTDGILQEPLELHEDAATITLWLAIGTALLRVAMHFLNYKKAWLQGVSFLLFAVLVGFIARTGYLGGELVFKHGAGIELALPDFETQNTD
ncbi:putative membrane protein [Leeuwenhoekiella aestuarii]|uniref:Putative membrane protein n=1 Tax=Leeuwenhoekiella aestuarii TaxID=2249426 RepID=A0A4Q0NUE7_9FLAO|nr:DUF2231 domain-containing protein [Leeuwenhoekiella aestuarii]RXG11661.1 putative membrane protein [Leeuwenhoekiella aestuarii]RXG15128.1 putative membrane protein [Leeuwenhoekiella aestuarii]